MRQGVGGDPGIRALEPRAGRKAGPGPPSHPQTPGGHLPVAGVGPGGEGEAAHDALEVEGCDGTVLLGVEVLEDRLGGQAVGGGAAQPGSAPMPPTSPSGGTGWEGR